MLALREPTIRKRPPSEQQVERLHEARGLVGAQSEIRRVAVGRQHDAAAADRDDRRRPLALPGLEMDADPIDAVRRDAHSARPAVRICDCSPASQVPVAATDARVLSRRRSALGLRLQVGDDVASDLPRRRAADLGLRRRVERPIVTCGNRDTPGIALSLPAAPALVRAGMPASRSKPTNAAAPVSATAPVTRRVACMRASASQRARASAPGASSSSARAAQAIASAASSATLVANSVRCGAIRSVATSPMPTA